ncbi:MAG: GTPase Era [Alphaproteobacteria bacterium]
MSATNPQPPDAVDPSRSAPRCGFVALLGAPNAGKSTLLNQLVGAKVSIVTPKVQTTRSRVLGIAIHEQTQLIFVDTPGIFEPRRRLDRAMVAAAWAGAKDADAIVLLGDAERLTGGSIDGNTQRIVDGLKAANKKAVLALNKIDLVPRGKLLEIAATMNATGLFTDIFMVSALTGDGVADLRSTLAARMPEGPWHFPEDQLTDLPMRLLAAETTREQLFLQLHQELPYALTVSTDEWTDFKDGSVRIKQTIIVERESQRAIVLGKGGARIKAIGAASRKELEAFLARKVHLFLFVKVRDDWSDNREHFNEWGLDYDA